MPSEDRRRVPDDVRRQGRKRESVTERKELMRKALALVCIVLGSAQGAPEAVKETVMMKKEISQYARSAMALTVRELEFPPGTCRQQASSSGSTSCLRPGGLA